MRKSYDDVGLLAASVAPGDIELGLALIWRQLEIGLGHALPGALIERIDETCIGEAALVSDAIAELGRGLQQRHVHRPAGIRAHEAGQRLWRRRQCRDLLLLGRIGVVADDEGKALRGLCGGATVRSAKMREIMKARRIPRPSREWTATPSPPSPFTLAQSFAAGAPSVRRGQASSSHRPMPIRAAVHK